MTSIINLDGLLVLGCDSLLSFGKLRNVEFAIDTDLSSPQVSLNKLRCDAILLNSLKKGTPEHHGSSLR